MGEQCPCGYRYECPCGCQACPRCGPDPAAPSRVSGAIGRGLADAAAGYRQTRIDVDTVLIEEIPRLNGPSVQR